VFFDAGATLVHPDPPVERIYARELAEDGCSVTPEKLNRALSLAWDAVRSEADPNRYGGVRGEGAFWRAFLDRVRGSLDGGRVSEAAFDRLAGHFRTPSSWAVYPDVVATLDELARRGFKLAVVSNWDSHLPRLLEGLGLADRFATLAVSAIEETGKPGSAIFHRACDRAGVAPSEALHVGDSLAEDYEGARAAGLAAVLLDRHGLHPDVPDRIENLTELTSSAILRAAAS
jgi:putative hydrolase of the HAD superfamily